MSKARRTKTRPSPRADAPEAADFSPPSPTCLRILAAVARTGDWTAEDLVHRAACPFCQRTERLRRRAEKRTAPRPQPIHEYSSLESSLRKQVDVAVIQAVLDLKSVDDIIGMVFDVYRVRILAEGIREIVQRTRRSGELVYMAENDLALETRLKDRFGLASVRIVRCTGCQPVIRRAADLLRSIIWDIRRSRLTRGTRPKVLVGIAGGPVTFDVMNQTGQLLERDGFDADVVADAMLPGAFWLHMGFDPPSWPGFQFRNGWEETRHLRETNFGGRSIVPMAPRARFQGLLDDERAIQDAVRSVTDLDVIVTSGAVWDDAHGATLIKRNWTNPEELRRQHGIVGELLWHPVGPNGPVPVDPVPMTTLGPTGLERLRLLIAAGKRVVAILGPCVVCSARKSALVKCLLQQRDPLITDLVIDAVTAEEVDRELLGQPGNRVAR